MSSLYKKPTYRPERRKIVKKSYSKMRPTRGGTDWWDPPIEYLDPHTGKMLGELPLVVSHFCFKKDWMTCVLVRDTDPIVVQGLRSVTSVHNPETLAWNEQSQECECQSCKSLSGAGRKQRPGTLAP